RGRPEGRAPGGGGAGRARARRCGARGPDRLAAAAARRGAAGAHGAASVSRAAARRRAHRPARRPAAARPGAGADRPEPAAPERAAGAHRRARPTARAAARHGTGGWGGGGGRAGRRPAGPGPNQMYDLSLQQFRRGSLATARIGFREFLRVFPTHEHAADALFYVGETWAGENTDSAAAVYQQVVKTYPNSSRAPAALYKLGLLAEQRSDKAA